MQKSKLYIMSIKKFTEFNKVNESSVDFDIYV